MFSELVDMVVRRTNRPDFKEDIIHYLNETLRRCHCSEFFYRDKIEVLVNKDGKGHDSHYKSGNLYLADDSDAIIVDGLRHGHHGHHSANKHETFIWERPTDLRAICAVKFDGHYDDPRDSFPANIPPGVGQATRAQFYYGVGNHYVFYRRGGLGPIAISYVKAPRRFKYYEPNERPAVFNREKREWLYLDQKGDWVTSLGSEYLNRQAQELVSDWMLADYDGMLCSGVVTKVFTVLGDPRNKVEYSNFMENLRYVRTTEKFENTGEVGLDR